ncbi:uncharacterized protein E0L32_007744 [Thyridium curvatum]|uniref:Phosphatidate phosphatase APP1 catalytic domain-containing protein n=1 Tax=Thyridium curvatum TaxID=1093900 RepID=A0A507AUX9_9PEZI|nr:uncharacterized protein E0L32_007744 [Thyridium curvatum]TPX11533.1 hypothetical protein E0L32_007744 [Thyridium curvatum]
MAALTVLAGMVVVAHLTQASPMPVEQRHPMITPAPTLDLPTRTLIEQRGVLDDLKSDVDSVFSKLGSAVPSYVASVQQLTNGKGVPNFFQDFPTKDKVQSSLGVDDKQLAALPTQVLNLPPYGNWSRGSWNVRFHGNVYKQPPTDQKTIDDLANKFLVDVNIDQLPPDEQANARNMTASIFVVQQEDQNVTMHLEPAPSAGSDGEKGGGGATTASGGEQSVNLPYLTTDQGDFDVFVPIQLNGLMRGDTNTSVQRLNVYANGTNTGNATAYLVPPTGLSIISDIDDILRVTKIYKPKDGLLNSFAKPFTPWMNMPDIYAKWARQYPTMHFHYLTTTPEQVTRNYMDFIYKTYPGGSFDTRPLNFSDVSATLSIRKFLLEKFFQTFPQRKIVLVGDTSNSDIMRDYPGLVKDFPGQVQCILLRNTSATDPDDLFPYDTSGFKGLDQKLFMFFRTPDDLTNIDLQNGNCYNSSVPQNITFSRQAELLGIHGSGADRIGKGWLISLLVSALTASILLL